MSRRVIILANVASLLLAVVSAVLWARTGELEKRQKCASGTYRVVGCLRLDRTLPEIRFENAGLRDLLTFVKDVGVRRDVNWPALRDEGITPSTPISGTYSGVRQSRLLQTVLAPTRVKVGLANGEFLVSTSRDLSRFPSVHQPTLWPMNCSAARIERWWTRTVPRWSSDQFGNAHSLGDLFGWVERVGHVRVVADWEALRRNRIAPASPIDSDEAEPAASLDTILWRLPGDVAYQVRGDTIYVSTRRHFERQRLALYAGQAGGFFLSLLLWWTARGRRTHRSRRAAAVGLALITVFSLGVLRESPEFAGYLMGHYVAFGSTPGGQLELLISGDIPDFRATPATANDESRIDYHGRFFATRDSETGLRVFSVPCHAAALTFLALPATTALNCGVTARRRRSRISRGLCPACAYDLRGSAHRCPECGTALPGGFGDMDALPNLEVPRALRKIY